MALRKVSDSEDRVTAKEAFQIFQENQMNVPMRTFQMMVDLCEDSKGIDHRKLLKSLATVQSRSGRDSVMAQCAIRDKDIEREQMTEEERDADLTRRLREQMTKDAGHVDLCDVRAAFLAEDVDKAGELSKDQMISLGEQKNLPVYGAVLNSLLQRCEGGTPGKVSWPEVMSFLEKANSFRGIAALRKGVKIMGSGAASRDRKSEKDGAKNSNTTAADCVSEGSPSGELEEVKGTKKGTATISKNGSVTEQAAAAGQGREGSAGDKPSRFSFRGFKQKFKRTDSQQSIASSGKSGKKKQEDTEPFVPTNGEQEFPEGEVVPSGDTITEVTEDAETGSSTIHSQDTRSAEGHYVTVKGKTVPLWPPDDIILSEVITDPPQDRLKLDWIYGYRGNDCRSNIYRLKTGCIVYFCSTVAILYDREKHTQKHYKEHTDEIKCLAVHTNGIIIATGQGKSKNNLSTKPHVRVWRADTLETVAVLGEDFFNSPIMALSFAREKDRLCVVDEQKDYLMSVWDTNSQKMLAKTKMHVALVCDVGFTTHNPDVVVSIGKEHLLWWRISVETGTIQVVQTADYQNYLKARYVTCLIHNDRGDLITGDSNGTVYVWGSGGSTITNFIKHAHDGPVFSLLLLRNILLTSGRDGMVYGWLWHKNMDRMGELQIPKNEGAVRMLQVDGDHLIMGTTTNSILTAPVCPQGRNPVAELSLSTTSLTQGHFDSVRMLSIPDKDSSGFLTAGSDGQICCVDAKEQKILWKQMIKCRILCGATTQQRGQICIGRKGRALILDLDKDEEDQIHLIDVADIMLDQQVPSAIRYSPDGDHIAVGCVSGDICILSYQDTEDGEKDWALQGICQGHQGPVVSLDWSAEPQVGSYILHSCTGSAESYLWDISSLELVKDSMNKTSIKYETHQARYSFDTSGIWQSKRATCADVSCVDVNLQQKLVAMGDTGGFLSLFRYPCCGEGAYSHTYKGLEEISDVRFTADGRYLFCVGQPGGAVWQWRII